MNLFSAKNRYKLTFILPALLLVTIFFILPVLFNFYFSFTRWSAYQSGIKFVGLENFKDMTSDGSIWKDLITTVKYGILVCIFQNIFGLVMALALEKSNRINNVLRTIFFIPVIFSTLTAGYLFKIVLGSQGPINAFLGLLLNGNPQIQFLGSMTWTIVLVALVHSWKYFGINMLVYIAGLQLIPEELIEASRVEGVSNWQLITKIKLPLIGPSFTFGLVVSLIGSFSAFELPLIMTHGGPGTSTEVLNLLVFRYFGAGVYGYSIAVALVIFILVCVVAFPMILIMRRREIEI